MVLRECISNIKMTSAQITRGSTNATTNVTDSVDNTGGAYAWLEQKVWLPLPAPVISVLRIFPITDHAQLYLCLI